MKHIPVALAVLVACAPVGLQAQVDLTEDFESSPAGSGTPPAGWSLVGVSGGTPVYVTSTDGKGSDGSGSSSGLAGQVSSTTTPTNTEFPGAYLVSDQVFSLASPLSGTFDFRLVHEASYDDVGFIIGAVGDGITGASAGELLYARMTEGAPNTLAGILQDGDGGSSDRLDEQPATILDDTWYHATVAWTPTSGTAGDFSITINDFTSEVLTLSSSGFSFDSAAAQIGFGSINDTIRFDNVNFTGTPHDGTPNPELAIDVVSVDLDSNIHLLLTGTPDTSYRVYRSSVLEGPLYRKRWSERFAGAFPTGETDVPLIESVGSDPQGFYAASRTEPRARIMCVGNSITEGGSSYYVYRPVLNSQLLAAGYRFEFVGSKVNTMGGVTLKHEGYSGKRADQIAAILAGTFPGNVADIVLLHAGHNNDATIDSEAVILDRVEAATRSMITTARTHNPDVIVLLAQVITSAKLPKYSYIPALNSRLAEVAAELDSAEQPVIIVNQADGWDPVADTVTDQVHPSEGGAIKMADQWFATLQPWLE